MNLIINIFLLFVSLILFALAGCPNYSNNKYIQHKVIIFIIVYCTQFLLLLIGNIINKQIIDINKIALNCLGTAISAVLGYTLYNDILFTNKSRMNIGSRPQSQISLNITIIIVLFITFVKSIGMLFNSTVV